MQFQSDPALTLWCRDALRRYLSIFPADAPRLQPLQRLLQTNLDLSDRRTLPGHVTASGLLFDAANRAMLLIHHRGLNRWLQPGGHVDAGELPPAAARREVLEEVGFQPGTLLSLSPQGIVPLDVDSHDIPANARKGEPAHQHHDFRFAFAANRDNHPLALAAGEVADARWFSLDDPQFPEDLRRAADRLTSTALWPIG